MSHSTRRTVPAAVALAVVAAFVPSARAAVVRSSCSIWSEDRGDGWYTSVVYGYAVFDDQDSHTLRCYVTVDGSEQAGVAGSGTVLVGTAGLVDYYAPTYSADYLCTEVDDVPVGCGPILHDGNSSGVLRPACRDGIDNDLDGRTDYPDDPDCADWHGSSESGR
jgi:hypothetical protein